VCELRVRCPVDVWREKVVKSGKSKMKRKCMERTEKGEFNLQESMYVQAKPSA